MRKEQEGAQSTEHQQKTNREEKGKDVDDKPRRLEINVENRKLTIEHAEGQIGDIERKGQ